MTVPYCGVLDGTTVTGRTLVALAVNVNNTVTATSVSSEIRVGWSAGATADTLSGFASLQTTGLLTVSPANGEVFCQVKTPSGSGAGPVIAARFTAVADYNGYILKEVVEGDPTSWQLYWYSDNSPETLTAVGAAITPAGGVTDYTDLWVRYAFVGTTHYIKIWKGAASEPAGFYSLTDANKTTLGLCGPGGWGVDSTGDYAAFANIKACVWDALLVAHGNGNGSSDSTAANSYTFTDMFDAPKDTPLWVVATCSGSTNTPTVSCTNLVVDATVASVSSTAPDKRLIAFRCHATVDIIAGDLVVDYAAAGQTNCIANVVVCGGASTFAGADTALDATSTSIATGLLTPTFTNPYLTSGTVLTVAKANTNALTLDAGFSFGGHHTDSAPSTGQTSGWDDANDTDLTPSWTGSVTRIAVAAEAQLEDPNGDYPVFALPYRRPYLQLIPN